MRAIESGVTRYLLKVGSGADSVSAVDIAPDGVVIRMDADRPNCPSVTRLGDSMVVLV